MRKFDKPLDNVKCECGYCNKKYWVNIYATCKLCGKVLDDRAKFKYEMNKKLKLWRGKKWYD